jgi:hypothetical protein
MQAAFHGGFGDVFVAKITNTDAVSLSQLQVLLLMEEEGSEKSQCQHPLATSGRQRVTPIGSPSPQVTAGMAQEL